MVEAGPDNAIRVEMDAETGEPRPYLHVRRGLEALIARPVFYELAEMAEEHETGAGHGHGRQSHGVWFPVGPTGQARAHDARPDAGMDHRPPRPL